MASVVVLVCSFFQYFIDLTSRIDKPSLSMKRSRREASMNAKLNAVLTLLAAAKCEHYGEELSLIAPQPMAFHVPFCCWRDAGQTISVGDLQFQMSDVSPAFFMLNP